MKKAIYAMVEGDCDEVRPVLPGECFSPSVLIKASTESRLHVLPVAQQCPQSQR